MSVVTKVNDALDKFDISIQDFYKLENHQHAIYTKDMILFINELDQSLGISFFAPTIPEVSANLSLAMNQIKDIRVYIMESFVFNKDSEYVSGEKAFDILKQVQTEKIAKEVSKQFEYQYMLDTYEGYLC